MWPKLLRWGATRVADVRLSVRRSVCRSQVCVSTTGQNEMEG